MIDARKQRQGLRNRSQALLQMIEHREEHFEQTD